MNRLAGSLKLNCQPENVNCHSLNPHARLPKVPTNFDPNSRRISLSSYQLSYDRYLKQVAPCKRTTPIICSFVHRLLQAAQLADGMFVVCLNIWPLCVKGLYVNPSASKFVYSRQMCEKHSHFLDALPLTCTRRQQNRRSRWSPTLCRSPW